MEQQYFHFPDEYHQQLENWHKSLEHHKRQRAELRRCTKPEDVILTEGFRELAKSLYGFKQLDDHRLMALACTAGVLAHVKEHDSKLPSIAKLMSKPKTGSDKARVNQSRFTRLLKSYNWEEFYRGLIRVIKILDNRINVVELTDAIYQWGKEYRGIYVRQPTKRLQVKWATSYYTTNA